MKAPQDFERTLGYTFRNPDLLEQALTHSSFANEQAGPDRCDNERLEFLGDAILGFVVSAVLFERCPQLDEGRLSRLRAFLVSAANLVHHAEQVRIGEYLRLGKGEEKSGGRRKPAILADAFEALIGALYLDAGLERTREVLLGFFRLQIEAVAETTEGVRDFKSVLQEALHARGGESVRYRLIEETGPDHRKLFSVQVLVGEKPVAKGTGLTKKAAEKAAALRAIEALGLSDPPGTAGGR